MADASAASEQDGSPVSTPSATQRVKAMSLEEVQQLLARDGRRIVLVDGPDDTRMVRREKHKVVIGAPGSGRVWTLTELLACAAAVPALLTALFLLWWRPHLGLLGGSTALGVMGGMLVSYLYYKNTRRKEQFHQLLSMDPGLKGCQYLLGAVPSWINLTDKEKMEWLNKLLFEMWPYYDRGICQFVKDFVEPIMDQYKPPGLIRRVFFQEFTFGDAPFRIESIKVDEVDDEIDIEVDVRWCGEANITLGIDVLLPGDVTRINPKVTDIVFVATLKIILKPLVRKIPGFAAVALAIKNPPIINYRLNFGSLPSMIGDMVTLPVTTLVDVVINLIVGMLQWPNRVTVPLLSSNGVMPANDPKIDLEVERLSGRVRGVVRATVIRAKGLKSYDKLTGKSDPYVTITTTSTGAPTYKTRHISNSLTPVWEDAVYYLPVLEKDQVLRVEMFDHETVGADEFMGRSSVRLATIVADDGAEEEVWYPLGKGSWNNPQGTGKGEGLVQLALQYRTLEDIVGGSMGAARKGILLVTIMRGEGLVSPKGVFMTSYVKVKVGKSERRTPKVAKETDPRFTYDNRFTFYDVALADDVIITVMEPAALTADDELGSIVFKMPDLVEKKMVSRWTGREQYGYVYDTLELQDSGGGKLELEVEFLPHW